MRNPRRIQITNEMLTGQSISTSPPPENSLFWKMWNKSKCTADDALNTDFIQGIKTGTLPPVAYGGFNVSDAYYCFNGADAYLAAEARATDPDLKKLLLHKYNSYQSYNETFPKIWRVRDARGVIPLPIVKEYSDFEAQVASHEEPIYTLIVMIPCEYLWYWLASQLSPPDPSNLYEPWITGNSDPSGAYAMGNFLNTYQNKYPEKVDEGKAIELYSQAMTYEQGNFAAGYVK